MTLRKTLVALADVIAREAERNDDLRVQLEAVLGLKSPVSSYPSDRGGVASRRKGRRTPALLDPVEIARRSEDELRQQLEPLDIEQLRDIVAQYGMDPGKLVMKWKDRDKVINRVVELAVARSK